MNRRYTITDRLGVGGAAAVYRAHDAHSRGTVVVKVLHSHLLQQSEVERFKREIDLLRRVDSPHVIRLYDWGLHVQQPGIDAPLTYLVAEYVEGHTLADIIDTRGALPEADALAVARQVALGLSAIHALGAVHRDVKSQNIMIAGGQQAKLIDFGIARGPHHATLTRQTEFTGTLYYAPPEQVLRAQRLDGRADIYALGVVLYEMLSAELPIKERALDRVAARIIRGELDPLVGASPAATALVGEMMALNPADRPQTAEAVIARLDEITGGARLPTLPRRTADSTPLRVKAVAVGEPVPSLAHATLLADEGRALPCRLPETVIGRSHPRHAAVPDVDLWALGHPLGQTVSRRHCRLFEAEGVPYIEDLGSMNGTRVNGVWLSAGVPHPVQNGDRIIVGEVPLTFQAGQPAEQE